MIKKILIGLICIAFFSCDEKEKTTASSTWIGGEIVNPKLDYVILSKWNRIIDTIPLNENNFFLYQNDTLPAGLYSFRHNEYQTIFIEPGDSLMLRVNTLAFDESLSFSGIGGEKNNLLMEFFLMNEAEDEWLQQNYDLSPEAYLQKADSLRKLKERIYKDFRKNYSISEAFKDIATANIVYDDYTKTEKYTSVKLMRDTLENFPKEFFNYRDEVTLTEVPYKFYYPYYQFVDQYLNNLAYKNGTNYDYLSYGQTFRKIKLIDSLISDEELKNNLLRRTTTKYLLNATNVEEERQIEQLFYSVNTNPDYEQQIDELTDAIIRLNPGNAIPNVQVVSTDNVVRNLHDVIKKPTVLYFWSGQYIGHYRDIHNRAAELHSKYPEYDFIAINTDSHFKKWRKMVIENGFTKKYEYQLENRSEAEKKLVINSLSKAIIVDKNAKILEGNAGILSNPNIEAVLLGHLN